MPASLEALYRDRLRQDVVGEAIWEANRNGEVGDIGYIHYDGRFHKLFNIFDGNGVIPAPPELMRTQIFSQSYPEPKSYGATFRNKIGAGFGVDVPAQIIVANVQFSVGNRSAAFLHPRSPTTEKWFEETGLLSTYLMEHESEIKERYSRNHDFDTIWIIEATIHAASYRHGVVYSSERNAAGTLEMHPIIASGASVSIHYTTEDLHNPIIRGRECPEADADMHCIVIRPVRLRKRRYLKMQSTKVLVSVTSAFRSTLGGLFRSSASTSNPSTDRSLTRRGGDGRTGARDEAGGTHAADSLEDSILGPFDDDTARDTIDMVLDCILDDHPDLDGVLVDSFFQFDERMIGSEAATFRREVLIIETHSTSNGRFGIVKLDIIDCQSCGTKCYGGAGLIRHVVVCMAHQQLLQRLEREWALRAQRARRVRRAEPANIQDQDQEQEQEQEEQQGLDPTHQVSEDAQEPAEKSAAEQLLDLVRQVMEGEQDSALEQDAESAVEKVMLQMEQGQLQPLQQQLLLQQLGQLPALPLPQQLEQQLERLEWRLGQEQQQQQFESKKQFQQLERKKQEALHQPQLQRRQLQWQLDQMEQLRQRGKWQMLEQWEQRWELQQLHEAQVQVHRAHELHQAQKQAQKAQKRAQGELRW